MNEYRHSTEIVMNDYTSCVSLLVLTEKIERVIREQITMKFEVFYIFSNYLQMKEHF